MFCFIFIVSVMVVNFFNVLESFLYFEFYIFVDCDYVCINNLGGYNCVCYSGYELDFDKKFCIGMKYFE